MTLRIYLGSGFLTALPGAAVTGFLTAPAADSGFFTAEVSAEAARFGGGEVTPDAEELLELAAAPSAGAATLTFLVAVPSSVARTRDANCREQIVSSASRNAGEQLTIMRVFECPPREFCRM